MICDTVCKKNNSAEPDTKQTLVNEVMRQLQLKKIKFTLRGKINIFNSIWQPFIVHYNKNNP